ncbi:hypothetical protein [Streptomyces sp. MUSC 14]|uniref:hypothetical protein n=1 Tax=Streptomyces sp. MUSC 14 TaxID=1354889 RepID=UPI0009A0E0FD|nr:hypothetical protein [Streptomyces sp. MUSC 14]
MAAVDQEAVGAGAGQGQLMSVLGVFLARADADASGGPGEGDFGGVLPVVQVEGGRGVPEFGGDVDVTALGGTDDGGVVFPRRNKPVGGVVVEGDVFEGVEVDEVEGGVGDEQTRVVDAVDE